MKLNKLMLGLMAGMMFVSCSDDLSKQPEVNPDAIGSEGFIGISIGMPTGGVTRGLNDQFDDGLPGEYGVTNAALIFFTGKEADAKFYKAYSIGNGEWNSVADNPNQITENRIVTFPVSFAKDSSEDLWVLAVINPGSVLKVETGNKLTVGGAEFTGTFKEFLAKTTTATLTGTDQFFMTNAPYSSQPGTTSTKSANAPTGAKFRVLSPVNKDRICETKQAAEENPAAAIFVERAVAKVEVIDKNLSVADGAINFPKGDFSITNVDWVLDNTEPATFIVRNLDFNYDGTNVPYWAYYDTNTTNLSLKNRYRFLGNAGFGHTFWPNTPDPDEHYRTYFCVDPNGNGIDEGKNLKAAPSGDFVNTDVPLYCYENTFDVKHMDYRNTTRAVIKVNYGNTGNLYTVGEDKRNVYIFEDAASYLAFDVLYDANVVAAWKAYYESKGQTYNNQATTEGMKYNRGTLTGDNVWMTIKYRRNETKGRLEVESVVLKDGEDKAITPAFDSATTAKNVNEKGTTVKYYKDGVAYYAVRIRHFGNDLAPWTPAQETTNTTDESYGRNGENGTIGAQDIQNYLGRYGVVRNNWYVLNLGTINQMGEPVIGDLPLDGTPDDRVVKEESISCRINILSWAKRTQTDDL